MSMEKKDFQVLPALLCVALIAAMALLCTACSSPAPQMERPSAGAEGRIFTFIVADMDGKEESFTITAGVDDKTVGDALIAQGYLEGEAGPYGLYVKKVNGITADYDTDGTYWAFYIDGEYAMSGVDTTDITPGAEYMLKIEK